MIWLSLRRLVSAAEDAEAGGAAAAGAAVTLLYGFWQTDPWQPPKAEGGVVPKNERGNVECPPFAKALPQGTVHVALPGAAAVCRQLKIDFAPALVGFEVGVLRS